MKKIKQKNERFFYTSPTSRLLGDIATIKINKRVYGPFDVESSSRIVKNVLNLKESE